MQQNNMSSHAAPYMASSHTQTVDGPGGKEPKKRAFHNKVKTGCKTCKIRRIRCDEAKPSCQNCLSTGRKCDGYATLASRPQPSAPSIESLGYNAPNAGNDLRLLSTQNPPDEMRSFRFFMEVAAPSLAGVLQTDFWLKEIPRVCLADQAVWHAAVSLGSSHEGYFSSPSSPNKNSFAIKHFNMAIAALIQGGSISDPWKALTISIIFTCICILDGQLDQSRLHFRSGCSLLRAIETAAIQPGNARLVPGNAPVLSRRELKDPPVSIASMRSMLVSFQFLETKLDRMKISTPPSLLSKNDKYSLEMVQTASAIDAVLAAESLMYALAIDSLAQAKRLREIYAEKGWEGLPSDGPPQKDHHHVFTQMNRTIGSFKAELELSSGLPARPAELLELRKAYLSLCVLQSTNRLLLNQDPDEPDPEKRMASLPTLCTEIVTMAEDLFGSESTIGCLRVGGPICTPTIINPLIAVVKWGFGRENRERARRLLNLPRLEGLWDFRMVAHMTDVMLEREERSTEGYSQGTDLDGVYIADPTARGWKPEDRDERAIHPLARTCNTSIHHITARKVRFTVRTWREWLEGHPGEDTIITW